MELELTHAVLSWVVTSPMPPLPSPPEAADSQYAGIYCIVCQSRLLCLSNPDGHGFERACSFAYILQPAPSQGPSPRLFSPPQIEIRTCPMPACQKAETSIAPGGAFAHPLPAKLSTGSVPNCQWAPGHYFDSRWEKKPMLLASLLFWIPHTVQTVQSPDSRQGRAGE